VYHGSSTTCRANRLQRLSGDNQLLRTALENELAVESKHNQQVIHLALEAQLVGSPFDHLFDREVAEHQENENTSTADKDDETDNEPRKSSKPAKSSIEAGAPHCLQQCRGNQSNS